MIEDRLKEKLIHLGYTRMDTNNPGFYLYYYFYGGQLTVISSIHAVNGNELTPLHYKQLLEKVKENLGITYPGTIHLLSLVFTRKPEEAKHLFADAVEDSHWIIDKGMNRLMLFETQSDDFNSIRAMLEQLLTEEPTQAKVMLAAASPFTWINTIIIVINILAFFIIQYTPLFGGENRAFLNGALNWYYVIKEKQYYRLLTSMFMHVDWSHLVNNMFVMLFIGSNLERAAGKLRYLIIYFTGGILGGCTSIGYNMWREKGSFVFGDSVMAIGASGAIFALVGAMLYIVIINKGRLEQISTRQMTIFVLLSLYSGVINPQTDSADHIGGVLAGMLLALILYRRPSKTAGINSRI